MALNTIAIMGRLTADPELISTQTGKYVTDFTVAVDRYGSDVTDFIRCRAWEKQAENLCKWKRKGDQLVVLGSLNIDKYKTKEGYDREAVRVVARQVDFIYAQKPQEEQPAQTYEAPAPKPAPAPQQQQFEPVFDQAPDDDDLPF